MSSRRALIFVALCVGVVPARAWAAPTGGVTVEADADAVARAAAETLVEVVAEAKAEGRRAAVVLSGGNTPRRLFALLAGPYRERVDWTHLEVFFGDERAVPTSHADSNFGSAAALWLNKVPIPSAQVHRMPADEPDLAGAAQRYARTISTRLGGRPRFDLVWLGVGNDGHTASLFPGGEGMERGAPAVLAVARDDGAKRLTLTRGLLSRARRVQFLVTGADKAQILAQLHDAHAGGALPARRVARGAKRVDWLVDRPAAALLTSRTMRGRR